MEKRKKNLICFRSAILLIFKYLRENTSLIVSSGIKRKTISPFITAVSKQFVENPSFVAISLYFSFLIYTTILNFFYIILS